MLKHFVCDLRTSQVVTSLVTLHALVVAPYYASFVANLTSMKEMSFPPGSQDSNPDTLQAACITTLV